MALQRRRGSFHAPTTADKIEPPTQTTLVLACDGVGREPALAGVYPLDGARLVEGLGAGGPGIRIGLAVGVLTLDSVKVRAPTQGGGVAVLTCQNARATISSIPLPGRNFTAPILVGSVENDSRGDPIVRMPAE